MQKLQMYSGTWDINILGWHQANGIRIANSTYSGTVLGYFSKSFFPCWWFEQFFVVPPGFEPGRTEPKSVVLPLHHGTIKTNFHWFVSHSSASTWNSFNWRNHLRSQTVYLLPIAVLWIFTYASLSYDNCLIAEREGFEPPRAYSWPIYYTWQVYPAVPIQLHHLSINCLD